VRISAIASCARRLGRNPQEDGRKSASKMGSSCNRLYAALAGLEFDELPTRNAISLHFCYPRAADRLA
jgi:hypothetical protein